LVGLQSTQHCDTEPPLPTKSSPHRVAPNRDSRGIENLKLLLDEMYPPVLPQVLRDGGMEASTVARLGLAGRSDQDVLAAAAAEGYVLLTENVADFACITIEYLAGGHRPGVVIALSSRCSRRADGIHTIAVAVRAVADEHLEDRPVYLEVPRQ
jgi:predicted nuclease of predicted toxin-antitoxin system